MNIFRKTVDKNKYYIVTYFLEATNVANLRDVAWALAIGQSVGNPNVRNQWETIELFENHACLILAEEKDLNNKASGVVNVAFPLVNIDFNTDGIAHMLCQVMGGQLDIDIIEKCHVLNIEFPESVRRCFLGPKYGITGIRAFTKCYGKPLLGGILKPKIGMSPNTLLNMVKELVKGGVNFIKEDEILSNPNHCPINVRVPLVAEYLKKKNVIYAVSITADPVNVVQRVKDVYSMGANAVHINFWSGLGIYNEIRKLDLPMFLFFQKSGDKILTNNKHNYHISWNVICYLAGLMGVDFIHAGMWGGYMNDTAPDLTSTLKILHESNVLPSLSCGMQPGLVQAINKRFGVDYMANVGGAIHGHPQGTLAGTMAMRQAIDNVDGIEYKQAIKKWGLVI